MGTAVWKTSDEEGGSLENGRNCGVETQSAHNSALACKPKARINAKGENTIREATAINRDLLVDYFSQNSMIIAVEPRITAHERA